MSKLYFSFNKQCYIFMMNLHCNILKLPNVIVKQCCAKLPWNNLNNSLSNWWSDLQSVVKNRQTKCSCWYACHVYISWSSKDNKWKPCFNPSQRIWMERQSPIQSLLLLSKWSCWRLLVPNRKHLFITTMWHWLGIIKWILWNELKRHEDHAIQMNLHSSSSYSIISTHLKTAHWLPCPKLILTPFDVEKALDSHSGVLITSTGELRVSWWSCLRYQG